MKKEVNFSDALVLNDELCRIPGNKKGLKWSGINAHGWFSYEIKCKPNALNKIKILFGSTANTLDVKISIDGVLYEVHECIDNKKWIDIDYVERKK